MTNDREEDNELRCKIWEVIRNKTSAIKEIPLCNTDEEASLFLISNFEKVMYHYFRSDLENHVERTYDFRGYNIREFVNNAIMDINYTKGDHLAINTYEMTIEEKIQWLKENS